MQVDESQQSAASTHFTPILQLVSQFQPGSEDDDRDAWYKDLFEACQAMVDACQEMGESSDFPMEELATKLPPFYRGLLEDVQKEHAVSNSALRVLGFFLFHPALSKVFETEPVIQVLTSIIKSTNSKTACHLAFWCISHAELKLFEDHAAAWVRACVDYLHAPRFGQSPSIAREMLGALLNLAKREHTSTSMRGVVTEWVVPVFELLCETDDSGHRLAAQLLDTVPHRFALEHPAIAENVALLLTQKYLPQLERISRDQPMAANVRASFCVMLQHALLLVVGKHRPILKRVLGIFSNLFRPAVVLPETFRAWTALLAVLHSSSPRTFFTAKTLAVCVRPMTESLPRSRSEEVRVAGVDCWFGLLRMVLPRFFDPVVFDSLLVPCSEALARDHEFALQSTWLSKMQEFLVEYRAVLVSEANVKSPVFYKFLEVLFKIFCTATTQLHTDTSAAPQLVACCVQADRAALLQVRFFSIFFSFLFSLLSIDRSVRLIVVCIVSPLFAAYG